MKLIDWLLSQDESIKTLTLRHLKGVISPQRNEGYIQKYIDLYDHEVKKWGGGFYSPKWNSSTYTLLELVYMEVNPTDYHVQEGYDVLLTNLWYTKEGALKFDPVLDLCIVGMLLEIGCYLHSIRPELEHLVDLLIQSQNEDGGWNCYYQRKPYKTSSLHTTINVLSGLRQYINHNYIHKTEQVKKMVAEAEEFILKKHIFRSRRTNEIISKDWMNYHYPVRWHYDAIRAMEYFADRQYPYDPRMEESLELIRKQAKNGLINKGTLYPGKIHFDLGTGRNAFNTYRTCKILKQFDPEFYKSYIAMEVKDVSDGN